MDFYFNPLSANPTKWSNTNKQCVGKLPTNCLSVLDHFVGLALKKTCKNIKRDNIDQHNSWYENETLRAICIFV